MKQIVNKAYKPLFTENKRYRILMGGRGAGRSTVASQFANSKLVSNEYFRCAIMRYILGDIRNSIYREILDRATENDVKDKLNINDSNMTISYGNNTINAVGFKKSSGDQKAKLKSLANYNCVIIEEADEISEEDFTQLDDSLRTVKGDITIILLLNAPPKSHWIIKRWFNLNKVPYVNDFYKPTLKPGVEDTLFIRTSYEDNIANMDEETVKRYENYQNTNPPHYYNMIKGYVPETVKGKIYNNWQEIPSVPHEARLVRRGQDFGYSVDPTALVDVYEYNGGYILDEQLYTKGMSNKQIADTILTLPEPATLVIGDSSEPKSIDEIKSYGVNIIGAVKGADSVNHGIAYVQSLKISYTSRSKNLKEEYENYSWMQNKEGDTLNTPKDVYNHAMDALRYAFSTLKPKREATFIPFEEDRTLYSSIGI